MHKKQPASPNKKEADCFIGTCMYVKIRRYILTQRLNVKSCTYTSVPHTESIMLNSHSPVDGFFDCIKDGFTS